MNVGEKMTRQALGKIAGTEAALGREIVSLLYQNASKEEFSRLQSRIGDMPQDASANSLQQSMQMAMAIRERFEEYQQRERGLNAVIETAQDLIAIRDLDHVLQAIVGRARRLISTDIGYLSIYDREQGDFYVRATDGVFSENFKQIRVGGDVGICGYVARNRSPFSSAGYRDDPRFTHTGAIDNAVTDEGIRSILGVPLLSGIEVIGVLFVGDRYVHSYNAWEMSILSTLAAHASVAIENARLFEQTQAALKQAGDANALLKKKAADTQNAAEAHEQLTSLVAKGGGVKDICEMVAHMLDGSVSVIDEGEQTIYSSAQDSVDPGLDEASERNTKLFYTRQDKMHAALVESRMMGRSVTAFAAPGDVCRVSAVVGSRGLLGGLVIHTVRELNDLEIRIFERSSMVTGVVLLSQERSDYVARQEIPALFRGLLSRPQHKLASMSVQAARHGLDLSGPLCLALVQVEADKCGTVFKKMKNVFQIPQALFDEIDGSLVFISSVAAPEELRTSLQQLFSKEIREPVTGIVARQVTQISALPDSYDAMARCLATLAALGRAGSIFLEDELALYAVLFEKSRADSIETFLASTLGKLYREGRQRKTELCRTLLCYLDHGRNARAVASEQGIHINTVRQRLDAIDRLLGDWKESSRALEIHVALKLLRLKEDDSLVDGAAVARDDGRGS